MTDLCAAALAYAARGIPVFPCNPLNKRPLTEHGFKDASLDPDRVRGWWLARGDALIGVPMGAASGMFAIDLDRKPGQADGVVEWDALLLGRGPAVETLRSQTPSTGQHLLFKWQEGIRSIPLHKLWPGVEVKGEGGYVILPPSTGYKWLVETAVAEAAPWLVEKIMEICRPAVSVEAAGSDGGVGGDEPVDIDKVTSALGVISSDPYRTWFEIGGALYKALGGVEGYELFRAWSAKSSKYNERECQRHWKSCAKIKEFTVRTIYHHAREALPGWEGAYDDGVLDEIIAVSVAGADAVIASLPKLEATVGVEGNGGLSAAANNTSVATKTVAAARQIIGGAVVGSAGGGKGKKDTNTKLLSEMNEKYSVVLDSGKVSVLMFERNVEQLGAHKHERRVPTFLNFENFRNLHLNKSVFIFDKRKKEDVAVPLGHWWLKHPGRKEYSGITFQPAGAAVIDGQLNLWRGWGIEPKTGDWSLMKQHILEVLASGAGASFTYIINWMAWCVQNPDRRAEVALVFRGKRGSGKGTLGNAMCRIFGQHGVHISNAKYLTGFNAHLRDACFLFADEAYWPGDKSAEGDLKRLITEPGLFIEAKGRDAITTCNMLHVMMASNEDWIVPAGEHERRFAPFDVSDVQMQKVAWFAPLHKQLEGGGYAAMLHDLLAMKLEGWHPRDINRDGINSALLDQQSRSLEPLDVWWVELLESGTLEGADPGSPYRAVSREYQREIKGGNYSKFVRQPGILDQARSIEPRLKGRSDHLMGHHLTKNGCVSSWVLRRRGWDFKPLADLRNAWEARFPGWAWRDPKLSAWRYEEGPEENGVKNGSGKAHDAGKRDEFGVETEADGDVPF